jgi:hypothetical protein
MARVKSRVRRPGYHVAAMGTEAVRFGPPPDWRPFVTTAHRTSPGSLTADRRISGDSMLRGNSPRARARIYHLRPGTCSTQVEFAWGDPA